MRKKEVTDWTGQLIESFGHPREPVDGTELRAMHIEKDYAGMAYCIREHLLLDMRLRIGLVNSGGPAQAPAWIQLPDPMPMYGTRTFRAQLLTMHIRKSFLEVAPAGAVVCAMAHELSHVVLSSTSHSLRFQEEAVDLVAMLLGFRNFFLNDCTYKSVQKAQLAPDNKRDLKSFISNLFRRMTDPNTKTLTNFLGYLSPEERKYAVSIMENWSRRGAI